MGATVTAAILLAFLLAAPAQAGPALDLHGPLVTVELLTPPVPR